MSKSFKQELKNNKYFSRGQYRKNWDMPHELKKHKKEKYNNIDKEVYEDFCKKEEDKKEELAIKKEEEYYLLETLDLDSNGKN